MNIKEVERIADEMEGFIQSCLNPAACEICIKGSDLMCLVSRLRGAAAEGDETCPDSCCDDSPCPTCSTASHAVCSRCSDETTEAVCPGCAGGDERTMDNITTCELMQASALTLANKTNERLYALLKEVEARLAERDDVRGAHAAPRCMSQVFEAGSRLCRACGRPDYEHPEPGVPEQLECPQHPKATCGECAECDQHKELVICYACHRRAVKKAKAGEASAEVWVVAWEDDDGRANVSVCGNVAARDALFQSLDEREIPAESKLVIVHGAPVNTEVAKDESPRTR